MDFYIFRIIVYLFQHINSDNMSKNSLDNQIQSILEQADDEDQSALINQLDKLVQHFDIEAIQNWRNVRNNTKNTLIHELVERNCVDAVRHIVNKYHLDMYTHRESDGKNPIQVAQLEASEEMSDLLEELESSSVGTRTTEEVDEEDDDDIDPEKRKKLNMVWVDLEMTSLEDPKIMECAVIITDKNLNELARGNLFYFSLVIFILIFKIIR